MGKSSPSPPAQPSPSATGAAQSLSNQQTAAYQAALNNTNQITPYGNQTWQHTAGVSGNASGAGAVAPQYTSTISLSPAEQTLLNNQQANQTQQQNIGKTALNQAAVNQATPYSLSGVPQLASASNIADASNAGYKDVLNLIQPQMSQNDELLQSQLANQGVTQGSEAYDHAIQQRQLANNQAYSQAALTGVQAGQALQQEALSNNQQGVADYTQQYNAPINEYQALQNGVQVQNPQIAGPQGNTVGGTNIAGITQNAYQNALNAYNTAQSGSNNTMNSLFGLGGSFLSSPAGQAGISSLFTMSDIRAKENIERIGQTPAGIGIYEFNYIGNPERKTGVMAQEVEKTIPDAVITNAHGYKMVNYAKVR